MTLSEQYAVFIFDHVSAREDVSQWYQHDLDEPPLHLAVFAGTEYQNLTEVGPQLLYAPVESELYDLARNQIEQHGEGAVFFTNAPFSEVCPWARQAVSVTTEYGQALCRFFEVSFLSDAGQVLGEQRFWQHLYPMNEISTFQNGEWSGCQPSETFQMDSSEPELFITQNEFDQLTWLRERRDYEDLARTYEAQIRAINPVDWVQSQCRLATAYGFKGRYYKEQWVRVALQHGDDFFQRRVITRYLDQQELTSWERWELIKQELVY